MCRTRGNKHTVSHSELGRQVQRQAIVVVRSCVSTKEAARQHFSGHVVASPPPCRYLPPTGLYESTSATTPDSPAESGQPSPEEDLECLSLPLSARANCMDWAANVLASTLPSPHPQPRSRVYSSAPADELRVGQVPSFHQLYVFHGGLFAAGFCEGYSMCQDNLGRQDLRSRVVPGRVGMAVPATFCFVSDVRCWWLLWILPELYEDDQ
ncbi:hypothetical protein E2C01_047007 [Portunus trituberculatus]|uniref:Uncharacterized protein n=1 Tax=Portunus trituberculatus TaxID=210409 RepID=A0A5B7G2H1_PORTR|nr:hypothetical protein [Portunus trituberculatus]